MRYPLYKGQEVCFFDNRNKQIYSIVESNFTYLLDSIVVQCEDWDTLSMVDIERCVPWELRNEVS